MGGYIGAKYEAVKDFVRWCTPYGYDKTEIEKQFIPLILSLCNYYVSELNRTSK